MAAQTVIRRIDFKVSAIIPQLFFSLSALNPTVELLPQKPQYVKLSATNTKSWTKFCCHWMTSFRFEAPGHI